VVLLFARAGTASWASNPGSQKPCTSQSARQIANRAIGGIVRNSIRETEDKGRANPPQADMPAENAAEQQGAAAGSYLGYFARSFVADQKNDHGRQANKTLH